MTWTLLFGFAGAYLYGVGVGILFERHWAAARRRRAEEDKFVGRVPPKPPPPRPLKEPSQ